MEEDNNKVEELFPLEETNVYEHSKGLAVVVWMQCPPPAYKQELEGE